LAVVLHGTIELDDEPFRADEEVDAGDEPVPVADLDLLVRLDAQPVQDEPRPRLPG